MHLNESGSGVSEMLAPLPFARLAVCNPAVLHLIRALNSTPRLQRSA
jgi:hypothetical protein